MTEITKTKTEKIELILTRDDVEKIIREWVEENFTQEFRFEEYDVVFSLPQPVKVRKERALHVDTRAGVVKQQAGTQPPRAPKPRPAGGPLESAVIPQSQIDGDDNE